MSSAQHSKVGGSDKIEDRRWFRKRSDVPRAAKVGVEMDFFSGLFLLRENEVVFWGASQLLLNLVGCGQWCLTTTPS